MSNQNGSVTDDFCSLYVTDILHHALGYPKPRDTHSHEQVGVIVCDDVVSNSSYSMVMKAIENEMKILLRVPNLSFCLHIPHNLALSHQGKNKYSPRADRRLTNTVYYRRTPPG